MDTDHYMTYGGRDVDLEWSNDEMTVWTTGDQRKKIGSFEFCSIERRSGHVDDDYFHLTYMYLEGPPSAPRTYLRQGTGREIISIVGAVTSSRHDGPRSIILSRGSGAQSLLAVLSFHKTNKLPLVKGLIKRSYQIFSRVK